ncbi:MAG: CotH kinase family protein [Pedosphaera sp.]|nr:CotH kinase family protein [uncultured Rhodococcus sp.]MCH2385063.1 CotH kinase family protein [Pedosphaera sp.]
MNLTFFKSATVGLAAFVLAATGLAADKKLTLAELFPADRVLDVQITVAEKDWEKIRHQSRNFVSALHEKRKTKPIDGPYEYVNADVTIDGVKFGKVGLRKKGFIGSQSTSRPSLKIKLNHTDKERNIGGLTNLTMNNNKQDGSIVSQYMGYAIFNAAGSTAPRCAFAKVTVNGKNLGIYSHVESMRKPLLARGFGNDAGTLYEGTVVDFYEDWEGSLEHKRGDDKPGREKIRQLIQLLESEEASEEAIGRLVDLDSFYRFWAIEGLLGFWDGYSGNANNFFIYLNPKTDRFHFMPWGADALFRKRSMLNFNFRAPVSVKTKGRVAYRLYQLPEGRERYRKTLHALLNEHWDEDKLLAECDRIEALIQPHLSREQQRFSRSLDGTRDFIEARRRDLMKETGGGMPEWRKEPKAPPVIAAIGKIKAKFSATWMEDSPRERTNIGKVELSLSMNGKKIALKDAGVHASWTGSFGRSSKPSVRFVARRASDDEQVSLDLSLDENSFKVGDGIQSGGVFKEGRGFSFGPLGMQFVSGKTKLTAAGMKEGDKVEGEFVGDIMKLIGMGR